MKSKVEKIVKLTLVTGNVKYLDKYEYKKNKLREF